MMVIKKLSNAVKNIISLIDNKSLISEVNNSIDFEKTNKIYFGDSVYVRISKNDADIRSLKELILEDNHYASVFAMQGMYSLHYLIILGYLIDKGLKINKLILPLNLRSFSVQWNMNPDWRKHRQLNYIESKIKNQNILNIIKKSKPSQIGVNEYKISSIKSSQVKGDFSIRDYHDIIKNHRQSESLLTTKKKNIFIMHYLYVMNKNNFVLDCWRSLIKLAKIYDINLMLYYNPINHEYGSSLFNGAFNNILDSNIKLINEELFPVCPVDFSRVIDSNGFFSKSESTEHLNEVGRLILFNELKKI